MVIWRLDLQILCALDRSSEELEWTKKIVLHISYRGMRKVPDSFSPKMSLKRYCSLTLDTPYFAGEVNAYAMTKRRDEPQISPDR